MIPRPLRVSDTSTKMNIGKCPGLTVGLKSERERLKIFQGMYIIAGLINEENASSVRSVRVDETNSVLVGHWKEHIKVG